MNGWRSSVTTKLNIDQVRSQFPALTQVTEQGESVAFLDSAGGTQVPDRVIAAVVDYYRTSNSNTDGEFSVSRRNDELLTKARVYGGAFVGGASEGIVFGQNTTTINFLLTRALGRSLSPGDEIVVTAMDHDSNVAPWLLLAKDLGLVVRTVGVTEATEISLDELREAVNDKTKVVAFSLASNATGSVSAVKEIVEIAHGAGALAWADGVAYVAHRRMNVVELGLDVLLTSPYKYFGPHLGMAWVRPELAAALQPERVRPASLEPLGHRFETGTLSHEAIAGFCAAIDYIASLGEGSTLEKQLDTAFECIQTQEELLTEKLYTGLSELTSLRLVGPKGTDHKRRLGTVSAIAEGGGSVRIARALGDAGVYVWNGNFYAQGMIEALGLDQEEGLLRFSVVHYNTVEEIERTIRQVRRVVN